MNYTHSISLGGVVLTPQGWFEWLHEFEDGDDQVTGAFVNCPDISFELETDKFDSDSFRARHKPGGTIRARQNRLHQLRDRGRAQRLPEAQRQPWPPVGVLRRIVGH